MLGHIKHFTLIIRATKCDKKVEIIRKDGLVHTNFMLSLPIHLLISYTAFSGFVSC